MASSAYKPKSRWNISKSTYFSIPPKQKPQRHYWYPINWKRQRKGKFTNKIQDKCTPCLANNRILCCKQIVHTTTFRSNQTNRILHIYHNINCTSKYVVYLLECTNKIQYVGKAETASTLDLITTKKMYGNHMLYLQAVFFQAKTITSTFMQNWCWLNWYPTSTSTRKKLRKG